MTLSTKEELKLFFDRKSVRQYDASYEMSNEELNELLTTANQAPSSWNLQHWHFGVFKNKEVQEKLLPIAYNQKQIVDASAVIAVYGNKNADANVDAVYGPLVAGGYMTEEIKETLAKQIAGAYASSTEYGEKAAIMNASLAAMQLMLAAKAKGLDTCPIGGFNPITLMETFPVAEGLFPVMLITVGKAAKEAHASTRLSLDTVTTWF